MSNRPGANEYSDSVKQYIGLVPKEDVVAALDKQGRETVALLRMLTEEKAAFRYAPDKWSIRQVIGHVTDAERIFTYRALAIARGETQSLPGFDENAYAAAARCDQRTLADLTDDYEAVRRASVTLFRGMPQDVWPRIGTSNNRPVSARALAYTTLGHERHHLGVLHDRYGV